jgi:hypothetical protein
MTMRSANARYSADPGGVSAQIDLIGVPWLMIGRSRDPHRMAAPRAASYAAGTLGNPAPRPSRQAEVECLCTASAESECALLPLLVYEATPTILPMSGRAQGGSDIDDPL